MKVGTTALYFFGIIVAVVVLSFPYLVLEGENKVDHKALRVLTYSSFIQKWGAGPEIARLFKEETGIDIKWINAGNAGLIIERLKFKMDSDKPDVVVGFDQFSILEARKHFRWEDLRDLALPATETALPKGTKFHDFLSYDWGPLTFIYRDGELDPPKRLADLVSSAYEGKIILQDPRMSSPGMQFLLWVLSGMGEEKGFEFLENLKPSIKMISPSWSSSYSTFKLEKPSMVFSYFSSPYYHLLEENDASYKAATFLNPHPVQVEYVGIPSFCTQCSGARAFAKFLLKKEVQQVLMKRNYMYPVLTKALEGTVFRLPQNVEFYSPDESASLIRKKQKLVNQWKKVFY